MDVRAPRLRAFGGERVGGWEDRGCTAALRSDAKLVYEIPSADATVLSTVVHKPVVVVYLTQRHARACGVYDLGAKAGDGDLARGHGEGGLQWIGENDFPRGQRQRLRPVCAEWVGRWVGGELWMWGMEKGRVLGECVYVEGRGARAGEWRRG